MTRMFRIAALIIASVTLGGCAAPVVFSVPDKLTTRGLMVAQIYSADYVDAMDGTPIVDNKLYIGSQNEGIVVLELSPGEHIFNAIERVNNSMSVPLASGGSLTLTDASNFKIERKFRIEAGRVTNLGMILIGSPDGTGALPTVRYLDNTRDIRSTIASAFPTLHASLGNQEFLANGPFEGADAIQDLRVAALSKRFNSGLWQAEHPTAGYVGGAFGAMARIARNGAGASMQFVGADSLRDFSNCSVSASQAACVISDSEFLFVDSAKTAVRHAPAGVNTNSIHVVNERDLVIIDNAMNFHSSSDQGATWTQLSNVPLQEPIAAGFYLRDNKNAFGMAAGKDRDYFYSIDVDADRTALASLSKDGAITRLPQPKGAKYLHSAKETDAGLFVVSLWTGKLWLLPPGGSTWQNLKLPQSYCSQVAFGERSEARIEINCTQSSFGRTADNVIWASKDGGQNWSRVFKPKSLFADR